MNSIIILCKDIKLDREYKNVLNYSEQEMLNLCTSSNHLINRANNYSFIPKEENKIKVNFPFLECQKADYIAFQNPMYSNKWFFAFIDKIKYFSNNMTEITYTIDSWSTWFSYWGVKPCFVEREHTNNDEIGANTYPEGLETGDYISCKLQPSSSANFETCFCLTASENIFNQYNTLNQDLPTGLYYYGLTTLQGIKDMISMYERDSKGDSINSVFVIPKDFFSNFTNVSGIDGEVSSSVRFSLNSTNIEVDKVDYLASDYIPINKKLLCYPYSFLQVSNHNGSIVNYKWEDFNLLLKGDKINFSLQGALNIGGSFSAYPIDYKNILNNFDEAITLGKFPVGGWNSDTYTNWITSQCVNLTTSIGLSGANAITSLALGNVPGAIGSFENIMSQVANIEQHKLMPDQARGNTNVGDLSFSYHRTNLEFKRISIKEEYARIIDSFFSRFGYKVNRTKVPNITGRKEFNYIKINSSESIGFPNNDTSVPTNDMDIINRVCRSGVTIWHNHENIGNYNIDNPII